VSGAGEGGKKRTRNPGNVINHTITNFVCVSPSVCRWVASFCAEKMYATMPKVAVDDAVPLTLYSHCCGASGMEMNSDMKQTLVATASQAILGCRLRNKNLKQLIESSELPFEFSAFINVSRLSPANFSVRSDAPGEGRRGKREVGERSNDA
jgi:hypothetical protein